MAVSTSTRWLTFDERVAATGRCVRGWAGPPWRRLVRAAAGPWRAVRTAALLVVGLALLVALVGALTWPPVATPFAQHMTSWREHLLVFVQLLLILMAVTFVLAMTWWLVRAEPGAVVPFTDASGGGLGAVSDLLVGHLDRIAVVQRRRIADIPSERLHTAPVQAHSEMVDSSLANIGSVTLGGQASISIGPLLIALKRLLRGGRGTTISGSVQRYGTRIQIVATVRRRHGTDTVMVERGARGQKQADAAVPAMVRELAYRVHFALAEDRMQAGTWELLESFTEARAALIKYLGSGKPEHSQRALELTRRTYEMDCTYPRLFGLFYCLGTSYFGSGEYEKAIQQLEIALTIHPRQPAGFVQLARCYCAMADDDRALALLERVRGRPPDGHPMAQYMLGLILGAAGEPERAIDELLRVERRPRSLRSSAWVTIAGLCSQLDDMRTYRGALGRVAERDFDGDWYGRACWLSVRSRRGGETDRETALESLQEALRRRSMPLGYALRDPDLYHIREGATFPGIALRACAPAGQLAGVLEPS